ncbi:hypothetical protein AgCh_032875 [Apium graveolens]
MLRNRSRAVTKQSLMADHNSVPASKPKQTTPISSFFGSPRFFNGFFSKGVTSFEPVNKPTLMLESPRFSNFGTPFGFYDRNTVKCPRAATENKQFMIEDTKIGLALINDDQSSDHYKKFSRQNSCTRAQLGSKLKICIPDIPGISTQSSQFSDDLLTPSSGLNSEVQAGGSPNISTACLSWSEMELSEDYTCVISHGPNPKTTRIFDNCIVESCCGVVALSDLKNEYNLSSPSQSFLSSCHTCNKNLGQGNDIYMYRLVQIHQYPILIFQIHYVKE